MNVLKTVEHRIFLHLLSAKTVQEVYFLLVQLQFVRAAIVREKGENLNA